MSNYYKIINGEKVWFNGILETGNSQIINPSEQILIDNGWQKDEPVIYEPTIEDIKQNKINEIYGYDSSNEVNVFFLNGNTAWFDKETRSNFRGSLEDAVLLNEENIQVPVNGVIYTLSVSTARILLAQIQRYADQCALTTMTHIAEVQALETIEEVEEYDITADYPQKLEFTL